MPDYHPRIIVITAVYKQGRYEKEGRTTFDVDEYLVKPVTREALRAAIFKDRDDRTDRGSRQNNLLKLLRHQVTNVSW